MNITVIHGSMRKGNTYKLTQAVLERMRLHNDVYVTEFDVSSLELPFCLSCHACFAKGESFCPHREKMRPLTSSLESCDAVIVSGVVYSLHLNAAMKNFIDHVSYYFHRPRLFGKPGMVVTTTAGAAEKTIAKYLRATLGAWGAGPVYRLSCKVQTESFEPDATQRKPVEHAADRFYGAVMSGKRGSPNFGSVAIYSTFRGMSAAKYGPSEYDKKYWNETGLSEKTYPYRINPVKAMFGALVYKAMRSMMDKEKK